MSLKVTVTLFLF